MTEEKAALIREKVFSLISSGIGDGPESNVASIWRGPRHNEIGMKMLDGSHIVLSVRDFI